MVVIVITAQLRAAGPPSWAIWRRARPVKESVNCHSLCTLRNSACDKYSIFVPAFHCFVRARANTC